MNKIFKGVVAVILVVVFACTSTGCNKQKNDNKDDREIKYSATASLLVTNGAITNAQDEKTDKVSGSDISASLYLTYTIVEILNTPDNYTKVAEAIREETGIICSCQELMKCSKVERRSEDTLFIDVTFVREDPQEAITFANVFVQTTCECIPNIIPNANPNIVSRALNAKEVFL